MRVLLLPYQFICLFFKRFYLFTFLERGEGREEERERNISGWEIHGCLLRATNWASGPQPKHVPWWGTEPSTFQFRGWHSIHWATPARAFLPIWSVFLCLISLLWLGLPILCWIEVLIVGILVLFLILEERLSAFHYWLWYQLWVHHIWPLSCWCMFLLYPLCWEFLSKVLNFVKLSFCIYWDNHIVFILYFVNVTYCFH